MQSPRRLSPGIYHKYFTTISRNMKKWQRNKKMARKQKTAIILGERIAKIY